jgi:hypothetical protein
VPTLAFADTGVSCARSGKEKAITRRGSHRRIEGDDLDIGFSFREGMEDRRVPGERKDEDSNCMSAKGERDSTTSGAAAGAPQLEKICPRRALISRVRGANEPNLEVSAHTPQVV